MESKSFIKKVEIEEMGPGNGLRLMYASGLEISSSGEIRKGPDGYRCRVHFFICSYPHLVALFNGNYEMDYRSFGVKLSAIKYFGKSEMDVIQQVTEADIGEKKVFAGTCLAIAHEFDNPNPNGTKTVYKVDIWLDGLNKKIFFLIKDSKGFNMDSFWQISDNNLPLNDAN